MRVRVTVLTALLVCVLLGSLGLTSCRRTGYTRSEVRNRWVNTYEREFGLSRGEAECVVDRFLGETSDDVLRPLTKGSELSDAQVRRIAELAVACGVGS